MSHADSTALRAGTFRRIAVVAAEEYRRALEGRWLLGFSILLAALILGLSFFGLAQGREVGYQGFARVTLSLMNLVLLIVPLTGLMLGVASVANASGALPLLLAQPVSRTEVFAGKFAGLAGALIVAQVVGFGAGGVTVALGCCSAASPFRPLSCSPRSGRTACARVPRPSRSGCSWWWRTTWSSWV